MPHQSSDDPPTNGANNAPSQGEQRQVHDDPPIQGGQTAPPRGQEDEPDRLSFPNCTHVISGDLLRDHLSSGKTDCPRCQLESAHGTLHFEECGHTIDANAVRNLFSGESILCPVCNGSSSSAMNVEATTQNQRSRITLPEHFNPSLLRGVSSDIIISTSGKPRFHVDPEVWKILPKKAKKDFAWWCNIHFNLPPGEEFQKPTNPNNPNHPNHRPGPASRAVNSSRRTNATRSAPKDMKAVIQGIVADYNEKVVPHNLSMRQHANMADTKSPVPASTEPAGPLLSQANVADTKSAVAREDAAPSRIHAATSHQFKVPRTKPDTRASMQVIAASTKSAASTSTEPDAHASMQARAAGTRPAAFFSVEPDARASMQANAAGTESNTPALLETDSASVASGFSASDQSYVRSTDPALAWAYNPTNRFISRPISRPMEDEIRAGRGIWDHRLISEWVFSPDFDPKFECIFTFCRFECDTKADLISHLVCDHEGPPPTGMTDLELDGKSPVNAQHVVLNPGAIQRYFRDSVPRSAQAYIRWRFPHDLPPPKHAGGRS